MVLRTATLSALMLGAVAIWPHAAQAQQAGTIGFQEVLANPDDPELNLAYVRQLVGSGELQQAASTLERMLLLEPDWDAARLTYGIVLYRLADMNGAVREFEKLESRPLSPSQESNRRRYLARAQADLKPLSVSGRIALGLRLSSNPQRIAEETAAQAINAEDEETDLAVSLQSYTRLTYQLNNGRGDYLFADTTGNLNHWFDDASDPANILFSRQRAGGTFFGPQTSLSVFGIFGSGYQDYERYQYQYGGGFRAAYEVAGDAISTRWFGTVESVYENNETTDFSPVGSLRDGWRTEVGGGVAIRFTDAYRLTLSGEYARKNAADDGFSYDRGEVSAAFLARLGSGVYSNTKLSYWNTSYDAPEVRFSDPDAREDNNFRARTVLGAPLETIFAAVDVELPESIGSLVVQAGLTYENQSSNYDRFDLDDVSGELLVIKRFAF